MGAISSQFPFTDPGSLMGGVREHRASLNGLQSDAFRSASQSQNTGQAARAFSGAQVTNSQTQTADLTQSATAQMNQTITIGAVESTNANAGDFNYNYLQRYIAGIDAADLLSRGAANIAQDQGGDQSAFSRLNDVTGQDSLADNTLSQNADVDQEFDVDLTATVTNTTNASEHGDAFMQARFRTIEANMDNQSAQAIFTSGQRQGHAASPVSQVAVGDGGDAHNTLNQTATIDQTSNEVNLTGTYSLDRDENTASLSPRTTDLLVGLNKNGGTSSSINSSAASQEQGLVQSAAGGVNEDGQQTENGIDTDVSNHSTANAINDESTTVTNSVSITI